MFFFLVSMVFYERAKAARVFFSGENETEGNQTYRRINSMTGCTQSHVDSNRIDN